MHGVSFYVTDPRLYTLLCWSVGRWVTNFVEFRTVYALLHLPNHPQLDCRVSGLVFLALSEEGCLVAALALLRIISVKI